MNLGWGGQALVQKRGQVSDGGGDWQNFRRMGGTPQSPPQEKNPEMHMHCATAFSFAYVFYINLQCTHPPGGYSYYFLTGCAARGLKPLPLFKDFSQKNGRFYGFPEIFANWDLFLRGFSASKMADFTIFFFAIFVKWDPLLRIFLTKMGPMPSDFCWKSNPFGRHIPGWLNMWVPPRV